MPDEQESIEGTGLNDPDSDADGSTTFAEMSLTNGLATATTSSERTFGFVAQRGTTSYVTWTDNRRGYGEVMLRIVNP